MSVLRITRMGQHHAPMDSSGEITMSPEARQMQGGCWLCTVGAFAKSLVSCGVLVLCVGNVK